MTIRAHQKHRTALLLLVTSALSTAACGHSEDEWQAQLAKYEKLAQEKQATDDEVEAARARAEALEKELESMGFKLSEEGAEREKLLGALEEYKARAAALERIKARFESLRKKLEELTKLGLKIQIRKNRMVISLPGDVLFASGKDELEEKGIEILSKVAAVIREDADLAKRTYQVAGHTDNQKITSKLTKSQFKDNWGLSLMRARTVLLYLVGPMDDEKSPGGGLDSKLWSASGYGETDPVANNGGKYGRQKNRRVELIMMPNVEEMLDLKSLVTVPPEDLEEAEPTDSEEAADSDEAKAAPAAKPAPSPPAKPAPAATPKK
jgi:chemotaxis protein MotB